MLEFALNALPIAAIFIVAFILPKLTVGVAAVIGASQIAFYLATHMGASHPVLVGQITLGIGGLIALCVTISNNSDDDLRGAV